MRNSKIFANKVAKIPKTLYDKEVRKALSILVLFFLFTFLFTKHSFAVQITATHSPDPLFYFDLRNGGTITLNFSSDEPRTFREEIGYTFFLWQQGKRVGNLDHNVAVYRTNRANNIKIKNDKNLEVKLTVQGELSKSGGWVYRIYSGTGAYAELKKKTPYFGGSYYILPCSANIGCPIFEAFQARFQAQQLIPFEIVNPDPNQEYSIWFEGKGKNKFKTGDLIPNTNIAKEDSSIFIWTGEIETPKDSPQPYTLCFSQGDACDFKITGINIVPDPVEIIENPAISIRYEEGDTLSQPTPTTIPPLSPCSQWANLQGTPIPIQEAESEKDIKCIAVNTAIGIISTEPQAFVKSIFTIVLGLAGGIALILIIISGYKVMLSQGNPEAITAARDQLISAIVGLLFIILSFVILQVIGVDILKIPGFAE